jgi:hypothetical protein
MTGDEEPGLAGIIRCGAERSDLEEPVVAVQRGRTQFGDVRLQLLAQHVSRT